MPRVDRLVILHVDLTVVPDATTPDGAVMVKHNLTAVADGMTWNTGVMAAGIDFFAGRTS